jgi:hypothetical protein
LRDALGEELESFNEREIPLLAADSRTVMSAA